MRPALVLPTVVALAAVACISGEVTGGEALPVIASMTDCSATGDACFTWKYMYGCYFGPTGAAGCSAQSTCHGSPTSLGAVTGYWVCGATSDSCWQGMTTGMPGLPTLVRSGVTDATKTVLYSALHKSTGTVASAANNMPLANIDSQLPSYTFTPSDLACISGWIAAGAKND
jgi:hypothetical protein